MQEKTIYIPDVVSYDPLGDGLSRLEYIDHMGDDLAVVEAARVSYAKDLGLRVKQQGLLPEKDVKLIRYLLDHGHESPLEMVDVKFLVKCPIFVARQWHRHRMASYNEQSRRYTSEDIEFFYPKELRVQDTKNRQGSAGTWVGEEDYHWYMRDSVYSGLRLYEKMLEEGIAREQARMFLPQNLYTRFYFKANVRALLNFYRLRADSHAQEEIRVFAHAIGEIMDELIPVTWKAAKDV